VRIDTAYSGQSAHHVTVNCIALVISEREREREREREFRGEGSERHYHVVGR
jgi:hypothetical protein